MSATSAAAKYAALIDDNNALRREVEILKSKQARDKAQHGAMFWAVVRAKGGSVAVTSRHIKQMGSFDYEIVDDPINDGVIFKINKEA